MREGVGIFPAFSHPSTLGTDLTDTISPLHMARTKQPLYSVPVVLERERAERHPPLLRVVFTRLISGDEKVKSREWFVPPPNVKVPIVLLASILSVATPLSEPFLSTKNASMVTVAVSPSGGLQYMRPE